VTTAFEIPLAPTPQVFTVQLGGTLYNFRIQWCQYAPAWVLDISDVSDNPILRGVPLVTGTDLLAPFSYLNFNGQLIVKTDHCADDVPGFVDLGSCGRMYFVPA
jgi:hypothetical protein